MLDRFAPVGRRRRVHARELAHGGSPPQHDVALRWAVGTVLVLAALLRVAASWNDLWLDEIWTLTLIDGLHSPLEIVTKVHHDNNHVLNSFLVYLLRPLGSDLLYRLPAVLAAIATVVIGMELVAVDDGVDRGSPAVRRFIAALVFATSHPLVHFGSEARGYAYALAFGLGAILLTVHDGLAPRSRRAPLCWALLVLAMLGHALAVHVLVALGTWGIVRVLRRDRLGPGLATLAWWFVVPIASFATFYLAFLRGITVGGGPRGSIEAPLREALVVASGLPLGTVPGVLLAVFLGVLVVGSRVDARAGSDHWVLFAAGIVGSPLVLALISPSNVQAARYFLVSTTLWLLLAARFLAWLAARGRTGATVTGVVLAGFVVSNGTRVATLVVDGRGSYRAALELMAARTDGTVVEVASDHDFRNRLLIEHFAPWVTKSVRYRRIGEGGSPQWYVAHRMGDEPPPESRLLLTRGTYRLQQAYPTAMLSGFRWFVYAREPS